MMSVKLHEGRTVRSGAARLPTLLAGAALLAAACAESPEARPAEERPGPGSIVEVAQVAGQFSALLNAVEAAGLTETLREDGPFTVFAPTDGAFAALPAGTMDDLLDDPDALSGVLLHHVVPGELLTRDLRELNRVETVHGDELRLEVTPGGLTVNGNYLLTTDIRAANGIIHVITGVLVPSP